MTFGGTPTRPTSSPWLSRSLPSPQLAASFLSALVDLPAASELKSLQGERDPDIFFQSVYRLADAWEDRGDTAGASRLFAALAQADPEKFPVAADLRRQAERRLQAQSGGAFTGERAEFLGKRFLAETLSPTLLLGMTAASCVGRLAYGSILARLSSGSAGLLTRGLAAEGIAATGGMLLEAPTYAALMRGSQLLSGHTPTESFANESLSAFLFLGSMKLAHGIGQRAASFTGGRMILPQAAALTGLVANHSLQKKLGLKPQLQDESVWADAAAALIQMKVGGHLASRLTGPRLGAFLNETTWRAKQAARPEFSHLTMAMADSGAPGQFNHYMTGGNPPSSRPPLGISVGPIKIQMKKPIHLTGPFHPLREEHVAELYETAHEIPSDLSRVDAMARLAYAVRDSGLPKRSDQLFKEAGKFAVKLPTRLERALAFSRIGVEWAKAGHSANASSNLIRANEEMLEWRTNEDPDMYIPGIEAYSLLTKLVAELDHLNLNQELLQTLFFARDFSERYQPGYTWDDVLEDIAVVHAEAGRPEHAFAMVKRIQDLQTRTDAQFSLGKIFLKNGEREPARRALDDLKGSFEEQELLALTAVDFVETGEFTAFQDLLKTIEEPYSRAWALLKGSAVSRERYKLTAINMNLDGTEALRNTEQQIDPVRRARLMLIAAENFTLDGQHDEGAAWVRCAMECLGNFLHPGKFNLMPEVRTTLRELVGYMVENYKEKDVDPWFNLWNEEIKTDLLKGVVVRLARAQRTTHAMLWASKAGFGQVDAVRRELALELLRLGQVEEARDLGLRIHKPLWRFDLMAQIYRHLPPAAGTPPAAPSGPPASGKKPSGGSGPLAFAPTVNAFGLGSDLSTAAPVDLWTVDPALEKTVPWFLLDQAAKPSGGFAPVSLSLELGGNPEIPANSASAPLQFSSPKTPPESRRSPTPPHSDRAPENLVGFVVEAANWVKRNGFGPLEEQLIQTFLLRVYEEMWHVLNFQASSKLAHRIAAGDPILIRLIPNSPALHDYTLRLWDNPHEPQGKYNLVQLRLNPKTGELSPLEHAPHAAWELRAKESGADVSKLFIPFYRKLALTSPGLKSDYLFERLNPLLQNIVTQEPTVKKGQVAPAEVKRSSQMPVEESKLPEAAPSTPTLLVYYRPLIFKGVEQQVTRYADIYNLNDDGRRRLQRLTQLIVAALHERELEIDKPENAKLRNSPYLQVFVGPDEQGRPERRVELITHQEAADREPKEDEIILTLMRYPRALGDEEDYSYLLHNYLRTDPAGNPMGPDLEFQNRIGLELVDGDGTRQTMHLPLGPYLHLNPGSLDPWNQWMVASGYVKPNEE